jgi:hypothetical protein
MSYFDQNLQSTEGNTFQESPMYCEEITNMCNTLCSLQYLKASPRVSVVYNINVIDVFNIKHIFILIGDIAGRSNVIISDSHLSNIKRLQQSLNIKISLGLSFQREAMIYFQQIIDFPSLTSSVMILDIHKKIHELLYDATCEYNELFNIFSEISQTVNNFSNSVDNEDFENGTKWFFELLEIFSKVIERDRSSNPECKQSKSPVSCYDMFVIIKDNLQFLSTSTQQNIFDITETKLGGKSLKSIAMCLRDWIIKNNLEQRVKDVLILN